MTKSKKTKKSGTKHDSNGAKAAPNTMHDIFASFGIACGNPPTRRRLPLSAIDIDMSYQRDFRPSRVKEIADKFEPGACGDLLISQRKNGKYYVVDGNHRLQALRMPKLNAKEWTCNIYTGISIKDEAKMWELRNSKRKCMVSGEQFKARLLQGHKMEVETAKICGELGFSLYYGTGRPRGEKIIRAFTAMKWIYEKGGRRALKNVLDIINWSWPSGASKATDGRLFKGLHIFIEGRESAIDVNRLCKKLSREKPVDILHSATRAGEVLKLKIHQLVEREIKLIYNKGLGKTRELKASYPADE